MAKRGSSERTTGNPVSAVSWDEIYKVLDRPLPPVIDRVREVEGKVEEPPKGAVAFFITKYLVWLFFGQAALLTAAYVLLVFLGIWNLASSGIDQILEGIRVVLPISTTLLGVAMGYYFREEAKTGQQEPD